MQLAAYVQPGQRPPLTLPADEPTNRSLAFCQQVARVHARNFYYGLKLTPEPKRSAVYAVYAFMRRCDDLVDDAGAGRGPAHGGGDLAPDQGMVRVQDFRRRMQQILDGGPLPDEPADRSIWPAFRWLMRTFPVEPDHLHAMLDGQQQDLTHRRYLNFDQLYGYCYRVASVVGLTCVRIWGSAGDSEDAAGIDKLAEHRGIAFQLTNILRDLVEDAQRGRVYLPAEELAHFGCHADQLAAGHANEAFDRLMQFQIERARSYYEMSASLDRRLAPDCRAASAALTRIYSQLLEKIAANPRRVLYSRVSLSRWQKTLIALSALRR